jgi:hypothetical protein
MSDTSSRQIQTRDMDDDWVAIWPAFGRKDSRNRGSLKGVGR